MQQNLDLANLITFLWKNFWHIPIIASVLVILFVLFSISSVLSIYYKKLLTPAKFAPSVMTATGLLGTFIGLSFGLKDLNLQDQTSMQALIDGLKLVFIYSLFGVGASIIFMLLNMIPSSIQNKLNLDLLENKKKQAQNHNDRLLAFQGSQVDLLIELSNLQKKSLEKQRLMQLDIANLKLGNDNEELASRISQGIILGLTPLLTEIKTAVADQGTEAIKKVLEDLKTEILVPMKGALDNTNNALETTNQAVKDTITTIKESQEHNNHLISEVGIAAEKMKHASESMKELVGKVDNTVQHMDDIQVKQHSSLEKFNNDLQDNLAKIQPAIQKGLSDAGLALSGAIATATVAMKNGIEESLNSAGDKLNATVDNAFTHFSDAQTKFDHTLNTFSNNMNGHLDRMATELQDIANNAEAMINSASENLKSTLGDIDNKLLNTADVLKDSLETFRVQYQESLTLYLDEQTKNLNGFLDRQNEQLEQTLGKQREGLVEVTNSLTEQFQFMDSKQKEVNQSLNDMINRMEAVQESIIPKVHMIALELSKGEQTFSKAINESSKNLNSISNALENMGRDLPVEFEKAFKLLNEKYINAFNELDSGLADAINRMGSILGTIDSTAKGLMQAITIDAAVKQN